LPLPAAALEREKRITAPNANTRVRNSRGREPLIFNALQDEVMDVEYRNAGKTVLYF
jgi:hypothetical protein